MGKKKNESAQLRGILRGMIPVMILSAIATMLGTFVDGVVVGKGLGDEAMSALCLSTPVVYLGAALAGVFSSGTQNMCAGCIGRGNKQEANRYFNTTIGFLLIVGVVLLVVIQLLAGTLATLLGAHGSKANLRPDLIAYLRALGLAIPFTCLTNTLTSLLYLEGKKHISLIAISAGTVVNVIGDLTAVYVLHAGMIGVGLATAICYIVSSVILLNQYIGKRGERAMVRIERGCFSVRCFPDILKTGASMAVTRGCHMLRSWIINTILGSLFVQAALTAFSVQNSLVSLVSCICVGIGSSTLTISSVYAGEENASGLRSLMRIMMVYAIVLSLIVAVPAFLLRVPLVRIFTRSDEVIPMAAAALTGYLISLPLYSMNMAFMMYFQGIRRLKMANLVCIFDNLLFVCLAALILGNTIGLNGVWAAFPIGEVLSLIAVYVLACIYQKRPVRHFDELLQLDGNKPVCERVYVCRDEKQILEASEQAARTAAEYGADTRCSGVISLCIEEYGKNILKWAGRKKAKGQMSLTARIVLNRQGEWKIYMKDNTASFDPVEWLRENRETQNDKETHLGIRLMAGIADDMRYVQALGLNTLIITVKNQPKG